ncbi:MAG: Arc family DNA-binding protein [Clostridiales bacterium]|jgi:predicted DNA-binding ribbon-helix-helix protein|nr:Arc family DNA-binding protein [Clostridiales bacterium]
MRKTFTLRLEEEFLEKLHYISELDKRSVNNLLEVLVEKSIHNFEKENGVIQLGKGKTREEAAKS